jgi:uracil-DNA glycosylase
MDYESESKTKAYRNLIERVRIAYKEQFDELKWCDDCQEINLWTYWQGRNNLDASIMLVGQDWGNPWDKSAENVMENIRQMNRGEECPYMTGNESITDINLIRLFQEIGYDITCVENRDLFFTNIVLGYRCSGISGRFNREWLMHDAPYFAELAEIIQPDIILCLGRHTLEGVMMAFNYSITPKMQSYNSFINSARNPVTIHLQSEKPVRVYALAHCGRLGTMNRNRGEKDKLSLETQINDWRRISL